MSNQTNFMKVTNCVIHPMERHWGADFDKEMIDDYVADLGRFDESTLQKAMQYVRTECKRKPTLAHIVEACRMNKTIYSRAETPSDWLKKFYEGEELKETRARAKAKNYCESKFREIENRISGWTKQKQREIKNYIEITAKFQADGIEKIKNRGYQTLEVFTDSEKMEDRRGWWFKMCSEAADYMHVVVPWTWFEGEKKDGQLLIENSLESV